MEADMFAPDSVCQPKKPHSFDVRSENAG